MDLYIHSAGRVTQQPTYTALKRASLEPILVVQKAEAKAYRAAWPDATLLTLPAGVTTLSPTRQWLLNQSRKGKFVLLDDDLRFFARRVDDRSKFLPVSPKQLRRMFADIEAALDSYAHVGICAREGGNNMQEDNVAGRMMRVLAYNGPRIPKNARFDRLPTKQDFDMTLQLLRAGLPNLVLHEFCHDQNGSQATGGCSVYRDEEMMVESAHALARLHPEFVKVVEKKTKGAWGGGTRVDVRISWKKALEAGYAST